MAIPFKITPDEVQVCGLSESSGKNYIYLRGTGLNNSASRIMRVNGNDIAVGNGRGLYLLVLDGNTLSIKFSRIYDVYGSAEHRDAFTEKIKTFEDSDIFMLTSFDAVGSTTAMTDAMCNNLRSTHWTRISQVKVCNRSPYAAIGTGKLGIVSEVSSGVGKEDPYAELNIAFDSHQDIGSCGFGKTLGTIKEVSYAGGGYGFGGGLVGEYGDGAGQLRHGEYVRLTAELKISQERKDAGGTCYIYLYSVSSNQWGRSVSVGTNNTEWTPVEINFMVDHTYQNPRNDNKPDDHLAYSAYHMPNEINEGRSFVRNIQIQRCGLAPRHDILKKQIASKHQLGATDIYETPYHRVDWTKVVKQELSQNNFFNYSAGYANIPEYQYTVPKVRSLTDWDAFPETRDMLIKHNKYNKGEIRLGNRVFFEVDNGKSPDTKLNTKGMILEVKSDLQHFIMEHIGDPSTITDDDDLGVYEIIHIFKTNNLQLNSTTCANRINIIDRKSIMDQIKDNNIKNLTSFGGNFDKDLVMAPQGKILAKKFKEV